MNRIIPLKYIAGKIRALDDAYEHEMLFREYSISFREWLYDNYEDKADKIYADWWNEQSTEQQIELLKDYAEFADNQIQVWKETLKLIDNMLSYT